MAEQLAWINVSEIAPNRYQPRKDFKAKELEELAESIEIQGLIQPIIVRAMDDLEEGKMYELIAGERRWRATKDILGKDKIRCIIRSMSEEASQEAAITENLQRQNLNAIEEALAYQKLMDIHSLTQEQVAKRLGKSRSYIANSVRLLRLDKEIQDMVGSGMIEASKAWNLLAITDDKKKLELAKKIIAKNWTVDKVRLEIEKVVSKQNEAADKPHVIRKSLNGKTTTVATPSRGHRRKTDTGVQTGYFVLVELDTTATVKDFVKYMAEQEWKCWTGERAVQQLEQLKKLIDAEDETEEVEDLEDFDSGDKQ
jgi:ParB family chromosome partitioning protein